MNSIVFSLLISVVPMASLEGDQTDTVHMAGGRFASHAQCVDFARDMIDTMAVERFHRVDHSCERVEVAQ